MGGRSCALFVQQCHIAVDGGQAQMLESWGKQWCGGRCEGGKGGFEVATSVSGREQPLVVSFCHAMCWMYASRHFHLRLPFYQCFGIILAHFAQIRFLLGTSSDQL